VRICEKGRRIGFTWGAWAAEAALEAARESGGMDQFYMGYNQGMAAEFIGDCATFARWYNIICGDDRRCLRESGHREREARHRALQDQFANDQQDRGALGHAAQLARPPGTWTHRRSRTPAKLERSRRRRARVSHLGRPHIDRRHAEWERTPSSTSCSRP
jgi:hypothetical protein